MTRVTALVIMIGLGRVQAQQVAVPGPLPNPAEAKPTQPQAASEADARPAYRLQSGDTIDVRFFYNPELNEQSVQIRPDGRISVHLAGDVQVAGRTAEEVSRYLEEVLAKSLKTPRVSVQIRGYVVQKAFVSGEVPRQGTISLASPMTLLGAIGEAGGITIRGNRNRVILIRKMPDGTPARRDIRLFQGRRPTMDAQLLLQPFDVLLVPESNIARVDRWVDQYIRQLIPVNMAAGFTYLWQKNPGGVEGVITPF